PTGQAPGATMQRLLGHLLIPFWSVPFQRAALLAERHCSACRPPLIRRKCRPMINAADGIRLVNDGLSDKRFVYVLRSERQPTRYYTGLTADVRARLVTHKQGRCRHTASGRPWRID